MIKREAVIVPCAFHPRAWVLLSAGRARIAKGREKLPGAGAASLRPPCQVKQSQARALWHGSCTLWTEIINAISRRFLNEEFYVSPVAGRGIDPRRGGIGRIRHRAGAEFARPGGDRSASAAIARRSRSANTDCDSSGPSRHTTKRAPDAGRRRGRPNPGCACVHWTHRKGER